MTATPHTTAVVHTTPAVHGFPVIHHAAERAAVENNVSVAKFVGGGLRT